MSPWERIGSGDLYRRLDAIADSSLEIPRNIGFVASTRRQGRGDGHQESHGEDSEDGLVGLALFRIGAEAEVFTVLVVAAYAFAPDEDLRGSS